MRTQTDLWKWNENYDSGTIPGYTTWLYKQNRLRRPEEFVDSSDMYATHLSSQDILRLLKIINSLEQQVKFLKDDITNCNISIDNLHTQVTQEHRKLTSYGYHKLNCKFLKNRFRKPHSEESTCDCGWIQIKKQFKTSL